MSIASHGQTWRTMLAAYASVQVDVAERLKARVFGAGNLVDAVDRANLQARFATGTSVGVDHRQNLRDDLPRLAGKCRSCHEIGSNE